MERNPLPPVLAGTVSNGAHQQGEHLPDIKEGDNSSGFRRITGVVDYNRHQNRAGSKDNCPLKCVTGVPEL